MTLADELYKKYMRTYTNKWVDPFEMEADDIDHRDIAHGLSNICRFGGQASHFYSVASHSIKVFLRVKDVLKNQATNDILLAAILHDATEAYLGDIITVLKYRPEFKLYRTAEAKLNNVIESKYNIKLSKEDRAVIKEADQFICKEEKLTVFSKDDSRIEMKKSEQLFLTIFNALTQGKYES